MICVDSGCTKTIITDKKHFIPSTLDLDAPAVRVYGFNGAHVSSKGVGTCKFLIHDSNGKPCEIIIRDCLYMPDIKNSLISVSQIVDYDGDLEVTHSKHNPRITKASTSQSIPLIKHERLYFLGTGSDPTQPPLIDQRAGVKDDQRTGVKDDPLAHFTVHSTIEQHSAMSYYSDSLIFDYACTTYVKWHKRFNHGDIKQIKRQIDQKLVTGSGKVTGTASRKQCHVCPMSKSHRRHVPNQRTSAKATKPMECVHTDTLEVDCLSIRNFKYAIVFVDEFTGFVWVGLMKRKTECFAKFQEFEQKVATRHGYKIKRLKFDGGSEYNNKRFLGYLDESQIRYRTSPPYRPCRRAACRARSAAFVSPRCAYHSRCFPALQC